MKRVDEKRGYRTIIVFDEQTGEFSQQKFGYLDFPAQRANRKIVKLRRSQVAPKHHKLVWLPALT